MFVPGSYRDRSSRVFVSEGRVFRRLTEEGLADWKFVSNRAFFSELMAVGQVIPTRAISLREPSLGVLSQGAAAVLEHERVPVISYPFEWSFGMLKDAALLHLEILERSVRDGVMLKDATAYNIQFRNGQPVFIDTGSFLPLVPGEPWSAYRQFCEQFLAPLFLKACRGIEFQPLLRTSLEGIPIPQAAQLLRWRDLWKPGAFLHLWLHAKIEKGARKENRSTLNDLKASRFPVEMIINNLKSLHRIVERLKWTPPNDLWVEYDSADGPVAKDSAAKEQFVGEVASECRPRLAWDLGCNRGRYSRLVARHADSVVAMDSDHGCVELLYQSLKRDGETKVLPLLMNIVNATPAQGWRGLERTRIEDRARPDFVLCLGLIHHLVIAANIPLPEVMTWLADFNTAIILEFPTRDDPMVKALLRNKRDQYRDYSLEEAERLLHDLMEVRRSVMLPSGQRHLFYCVPRA